MARIAKALDKLRSQVNALWPDRDKSSDGWEGDKRHQAIKSDHNPNMHGVVQAFDITHDPAHGLDARKLAEALIASRDRRIKYVISNAEINSAKVSPWKWRPYSGTNAHRHHVHISVDDDPALYDDASPWQIAALAASRPMPAPAPEPAPEPDQKLGGASAPVDSTADASNVLRERMAKTIVDFEARRDGSGRLEIYTPPDSGVSGEREVAGITEHYNPKEAAEIVRLVAGGDFAGAERFALNFVARMTDVAASWSHNPGVQFFLRDSVFNRGARGAARILQRALGVEDDGIVGPITRLAMEKYAPVVLIAALRAARESYEIDVIGYRANLWPGLVNRWDKATEAAISLL